MAFLSLHFSKFLFVQEKKYIFLFWLINQTEVFQVFNFINN